MITAENDKTVYFDVDDTLLSWDTVNGDEKAVRITDESGEVFYLRPFLKHIENLKMHSLRGHFIIVWSAGGYAWAREAVRVLDLEKYVDLVVAKPAWVYDDLPANEIIPEANRRYYPDGA